MIYKFLVRVTTDCENVDDRIVQRIQYFVISTIKIQQHYAWLNIRLVLSMKGCVLYGRPPDWAIITLAVLNSAAFRYQLEQAYCY